MQILYKFVAVILDEKIVALADLIGRYRPFDGFPVRRRVIMTCAVLRKPVRKVLYAVFPRQAAAQNFPPMRTVFDVERYVDFHAQVIARRVYAPYLFALCKNGVHFLLVLEIELRIIFQKMRVFRKHFAVGLLRAVFDDLVGNDFTALTVRLCVFTLVPKAHDSGVFFLFVCREIIVVFNEFRDADGNFGPL